MIIVSTIRVYTIQSSISQLLNETPIITIGKICSYLLFKFKNYKHILHVLNLSQMFSLGEYFVAESTMRPYERSGVLNIN